LGCFGCERNVMGLFGKPKKPVDRFPVERLSFLPIGLTATIIDMAGEHGFERENFMTCRFVTGYLMGYPEYVDDIDENMGSIIRQLLFDGIFGGDAGKELFQRCTGYTLLDDQQTRRGWGAGVVDGRSYFQALEQRQDATNSNNSIKLMFDTGWIDPAQQTI
jgi:hypothetical protein